MKLTLKGTNQHTRGEFKFKPNAGKGVAGVWSQQEDGSILLETPKKGSGLVKVNEVENTFMVVEGNEAVWFVARPASQ